uniref:Venom protein family 2 protein 7 n=1 Tax=Pristhesancus plagipennis TaxID=1955184 RepID=A0A1Q1NPB7_PRIPG|nr:venom protein family 2 protein 7 [Pristhesancus plagipennis]
MDGRTFYLWAIISLWVGCSNSFKVGYGPPYFDKEPPPMPVDKDYNDLRDFSPLEIQVIRELKEMQKSRSFISDFKLPTCTFKKWNRGRCCLSFKLLEKKKKFCLKASIRLKKLIIYFALIMNRMPLYEHEIALSEFCAGLPYLKKISACIHFYHLDIRFKPKFKFKTCAQLTIASIFSLQFNCIIIQNGEVKFDHSVEPENPGIFVLSFKDGKMVFEFNNPIPPEIMEAIKNFAEVVKQKVVVFVRGVVDTAKKVWDKIKSFFSCLFWSC